MDRIQIALDPAKSQDEGGVIPVARFAPSNPRDRLEAWRSLRSVDLDRKRLADHRIVTLDRSDTAHAAFDTMRTKILRTARQNNWTSIGITSPTPECGKTILGLNLAFSLAHQKDCRSVLIDLDLRRPSIGKVLALPKMRPVEAFMKGQSSVEETFLRYGDNLAIGANDGPVRFAAETLQGPDAGPSLTVLKLKLKPDLVIFDLPPMLVNDDVLAFLPQLDAVLLVAAAGSTTLAEIDLCERELAAQTKVLGVVLNKCRYMPETFGY